MKQVLPMAVLSLALVACAPGASNRGTAGDVSPT